MKYFEDREFSCKCGCGLMNMSPELLTLCDNLREVLGREVRVTSGSRCVRHNHNEGGSSQSSHLRGLAVDIAAEASRAKYDIVRALLGLGVNRIGVGDTFIHFDIDPRKDAAVLWTY